MKSKRELIDNLKSSRGNMLCANYTLALYIHTVAALFDAPTSTTTTKAHLHLSHKACHECSAKQSLVSQMDRTEGVDFS